MYDGPFVEVTNEPAPATTIMLPDSTITASRTVSENPGESEIAVGVPVGVAVSVPVGVVFTVLISILFILFAVLWKSHKQKHKGH